MESTDKADLWTLLVDWMGLKPGKMAAREMEEDGYEKKKREEEEGEL